MKNSVFGFEITPTSVLSPLTESNVPVRKEMANAVHILKVRRSLKVWIEYTVYL